MADVAKLFKEYLEKKKELALYTKNGASEVSTFVNYTDFRDKYNRLANSGFTISSSKLKIMNMPYSGYVYKLGVKLVVNKEVQNQVHFEPSVEAGGAGDLYGVCTDIHEATNTAQIVPITEAMGFEYIGIAKDATIKAEDKVKFNDKGEIEKVAGGGAHNGIATADSVELVSNKLYLCRILFLGNRPA